MTAPTVGLDRRVARLRVVAVVVAALSLAGCSSKAVQSTSSVALTSSSTTTTSWSTTTSATTPSTTQASSTTSTTLAVTTSTTMPTSVPASWNGFESTTAAFAAANPPTSTYDTFPAYGPTVASPIGPSPEFVAEIISNRRIIQLLQSLPADTSISAARAEAMSLMPADTKLVSFLVAPASDNGGCAFLNLRSGELAPLGRYGFVTVELAYDNQNGAPSYVPSNVNTATYEQGTNTANSASC
jgi:outer membrane murein-binding lipoprotein Lpp